MDNRNAGKKPRAIEEKKGFNPLEIVTLLLFLICMIPFVLVIFNSAKTAKEIIESPVTLPTDWSVLFVNIKAIFTDGTIDYISAFVDSVTVTVGSLALIVLTSSMTAWVLVRNKTRWSTVIFMTFVAAMVIPFQVVMFPLVGWFKILGKFLHINLLGTHAGIYLAYIGFGCSLSVFIFHGFIKNIPVALEEAATIDGCSRPAVFFKIVFPLLQTVTVTVLILNGIWIWNDFLLPLLLLGSNGNIQTLPLAVTAFAGSYVKRWDLILTSALLAMLPIIVLFLFAQKYIIKGMVDGAVK